MVLQGLMRQVVAMQMDIALHTLPGFPWACIVVDIHLVILEAAPEAFNDDIVLSTAFTIHADAT